MRFLLDTNVVSEWAAPRPSQRVMSWLGRIDENSLFLSVVTLTELQFGMARLPNGRRRDRLAVWIDTDLRSRFGNRVIVIDDTIAVMAGNLFAERQSAGRPVEIMDAFIAATARVMELILVTRNERDFVGIVGQMINPWEPS